MTQDAQASFFAFDLKRLHCYNLGMDGCQKKQEGGINNEIG